MTDRFDGPRGEEAGFGPLLALGLIFVITASWWALALWPVPGSSPEWLVRTRAICFGSAPDGLPDAEGWVALILQPALMTGTLLAVWSRELRGATRRATASVVGRTIVSGASALVVLGLAAAGYRVATASGGGFAARTAFAGSADVDPGDFPRLDRPPPPLGLVDQDGQRVTVADLRGRPTIVTFAFGHCETVCPLVVHDALAARDAVESSPRARVVVVTLDPWRDTPSRLPYIARRWDLGPDDRVLGGNVDAVNRVLDGWSVARERDPRTGDITHPALVYVLDAGGRIAFAASGRATALEGLLERL